MIIVLGIQESSSAAAAAALCEYKMSEVNHYLLSQKSLNVCDFYKDSSFAEKAEYHGPHEFLLYKNTHKRTHLTVA